MNSKSSLGRGAASVEVARFDDFGADDAKLSFRLKP
jgi:hypothetical protein